MQLSIPSTLIAMMVLSGCQRTDDTALEYPDGGRTLVHRSTDIDLHEFDTDLAQRTCALYVAIRSRALMDLMAFDRDLDSNMVHWNMCDSGTMVACAKIPVANGDTIRTGIPWPYGEVGM